MMTTSEILHYKKSTKKLLILDYDGTLVDFAPTPHEAIPDRQLIEVLSRLIKNSSIEIIIVSGRRYLEVENLFGYLPLTLVAEHGAMIRENMQWKRLFTIDMPWRGEVLNIMNEWSQALPEAFVENKIFSVSWHYRNLKNGLGYTFSRRLISSLEELCSIYNIKILDGNKVVEVMDRDLNRGIALQQFLRGKRYDQILCIGAEKNDEDLFEFLLNFNNAFTITVGDGETRAQQKVNSVSEVIMLLNQLT